MPVDPNIKKLSVTKNDEADARSATFNFFLAGGMVHNDGLPLHPSQARDAYLRQTLYQPFHEFWSGAVSIAVVKMISKDFEITSDAPRLRQYAQDLHILADAGEGWISFLSKIVQDFLCTDNGAFVEIVRASKSAGSRILGIVHLDSLRVTRTGNAEIPAIYRDTMGVEHMMQAHQVMMFSDMPSPAETHHGVGLCAASRAWGQIVKLEAIERYIYDKIAGKRSLSLEIVKGIADKDIRTAFDGAKEMRRAESTMGKAYSYMGATVLAVLQDVPLEHVSIPFASLPDGFNRKEELSIALLAFANAIGLDPQDLEPLTGQAIGTGAQSQVLHEKAAGKGLAAFTKQWTHQDNEMLMPDSVTFAFKEKDLNQESTRATIEKTRTDTQVQRITAGIITAPQAAQILADAGDLPKEFVQPDVTPTETVSDEDKVSAEQDSVATPQNTAQPVAPVAKETDPLRQQFRDALERFDAALTEKGGDGSGNFGHSGRPGMIGGSGPGGGGSSGGGHGSSGGGGGGEGGGGSHSGGSEGTNPKGGSDTATGEGSPAREKAKEIEATYVKRRIENGAVISPDGKVILEKKGNKTGIDFTKSEMESMKGAVFTHNHPGDKYARGGSFSLNDVVIASATNMAEMRAVTTLTKYVIRPKQGGKWADPIEIMRHFSDFNGGRAIPMSSMDSFWANRAGAMGLEYKTYRMPK